MRSATGSSRVSISHATQGRHRWSVSKLCGDMRADPKTRAFRVDGECATHRDGRVFESPRADREGQLSHPCDLLSAWGTALNGVLDAIGRVEAGPERPRPRQLRAVRRNHRLDSAAVDRLIDDHAAGASINELAARYEVHRTTVLNHLRRRGDGIRPTDA